MARANGSKLHQVLLAGIGAAAYAKDGVVKMTRKWIARGEKAEPGLRKAFDEKSRKVVASARRLGDQAEAGLRRLIERLPALTRKELDDLSQRIADLEKKLARKKKKA